MQMKQVSPNTVKRAGYDALTFLVSGLFSTKLIVYRGLISSPFCLTVGEKVNI